MVLALSASPASNFATTDCRYAISATGLTPASYDTYFLYRVSGSTGYEDEFVISDGEVDGATSLSLSDYEFHFAKKDSLTAETVTWRLELYLGTTKITEVSTTPARNPHTDRAADSAYTGASSPGTWIKKIDSDTPMCVPVTVSEFNSWSRETNIMSENRVLGTPHPIIITDYMGGKSGKFTLLVYSSPSWAGGGSTMGSVKALEDLFDSGSIYYFQTTWPALSGIHDFYFMVRSYSVTRNSRVVPLHEGTGGDLPTFYVEVNFIEQERPADQGNLAPVTWQTVKDNYATWTDMSAANNSWLEVLQDG